MYSMTGDAYASKLFFVVLALGLRLGLDIGTMLDNLIASMHPEVHLFEWIACLGGAIAGQIFYRADTLGRVVGGLFVGYLAGLYGGTELAHRAGMVDAKLGNFLAAAFTDMLFRVTEYGLRHPLDTVDFIIDKSTRLLGLLGSDLIGKGLAAIKDLFKKN